MPIPDKSMKSVATDDVVLPEVHIGKDVFGCVVLCVD